MKKNKIIAFFFTLFLVAALSAVVVAVRKQQSSREKAALNTQTQLHLGANYALTDVVNCSSDNYGIIATYDKPGVREKVRQQLSEMRRNKLTSLRFIIWHLNSVDKNVWGVVPSGGGTLVEPYLSNLKNFVSDIKNAGFIRLTVAYGPQYKNNPSESIYDNSYFNENWSFIKSTVPTILQNGPAETYIDVLNEEGYSNSSPFHDVLKEYVTTMIANFVAMFGSHNLAVSYVGGPSRSGDDTERLTTAIELLKQLNINLNDPKYEVHIYRDGSAETILNDLTNARQTLKNNGITKPISIGETYPKNDDNLSNAIQQFNNGPENKVDEVMLWPLEENSSCHAFSLAPPYGFSENTYLFKSQDMNNLTSLKFKVSFQGIKTKSANKKITIALKKNNFIVNTLDVDITSDKNGIYSGTINNVYSDTYDFYVTGPTFLTKKINGVILVNSSNNADWTNNPLKVGDFNNDNKITIADLALVLSKYVSLNSPVSTSNQIYDVNGDGKINITDLALVLSNYTQLEVKGD